MPVGPNGERRPSDPVAAAVMVGNGMEDPKLQVRTSLNPDPAREAQGYGLARAAGRLTPERRR